MEVSKPVFASVVLLSIMGTALAYPFMMNVYVTNFPLDEQGNLRVSSDGVTPKVVTLAKDLNLSWAGGLGAHDDVTYFTIDVDGYDEFCVL